jgi:hypothetical protein
MHRSQNGLVTDKLSKMTYIEELEGSVSTLQGKHEALNGFQTHYDAFKQAEDIYKTKVEEYNAEHGDDPTEELESVRNDKIATYETVCELSPDQLTPPLFEFITKMKTLYPDGVPAPELEEKAKSKRSTELNPRQRKYLLPLFQKALTAEYQSNDQIQAKVMEALGAKADGQAESLKFFNTSRGGVVNEDGKAYKYGGDKTVREIFIGGKFGEFTTMPYIMVKQGLAEGESRRVKGEKGQGNKPFYRLMTEKEITEAPPAAEETQQEPKEDLVPEMESSLVDEDGGQAATEINW